MTIASVTAADGTVLVEGACAVLEEERVTLTELVVTTGGVSNAITNRDGRIDHRTLRALLDAHREEMEEGS